MRRNQRHKETPSDPEWRATSKAGQRSSSTVIGGYTEEGAKELDRIRNERTMSTKEWESKRKSQV